MQTRLGKEEWPSDEEKATETERIARMRPPVIDRCRLVARCRDGLGGEISHGRWGAVSGRTSPPQTVPKSQGAKRLRPVRARRAAFRTVARIEFSSLVEMSIVTLSKDAFWVASAALGLGVGARVGWSDPVT